MPSVAEAAAKELTTQSELVNGDTKRPMSKCNPALAKRRPWLQASRLRDELASLKQEHAVLSTDFEQVKYLCQHLFGQTMLSCLPPQC